MSVLSDFVDSVITHLFRLNIFFHLQTRLKENAHIEK